MFEDIDWEKLYIQIKCLNDLYLNSPAYIHPMLS